MTLKKALVAITVVAMLFGMVGVAFAGGFSDITDNTTAAAATRLNALGIINGFPDGTFGGSQSITRAQFAAVAVRALGLDSAASYAKGATKFSDVAADHWATGYINIATQQGIVKGFPDGTFAPEAPVTYAEALAMIVRMMGYEPVVKGEWPTNYIVQASRIGFSNGVEFGAGANATRSDVALFVDNSLTEPLMVQTGVIGGEPSYSNTDTSKTILSQYLNATPTSGLLVDSPDVLATAANSIEIKPATGSNVTMTLADGVSAAGLLGRNVTAWEKSGKVFYVEGTDAASAFVSGKIKALPAANEITLDNNKTYTYDGNTEFFHNGVAGLSLTTGDDATLLLDGTNAVSVVNYTYVTGVVTDIDVAGSLVYTSAGNLDFSDSSARYSITMGGKAVGVADLKDDDVVQFYGGNAAADNKVVIVTRKVVAGTLTQVNSDGSVVIAGTTYDQASGIDLSGASDIYSFIGDNVSALLNKDGEIAKIDTVSSTATSTYAVVTGGGKRPVNTTNGVEYYFTAVKGDDTTIYLQLADKVSVNGASAVASSDVSVALADNDVISYSVDSTGAVDAYTTPETNPNVITPYTGTVDTTNSLINGKLVTASTVIFNVPGGTTAPSGVTPADFLKNSSVTSAYIVGDSNVAARAALIVYTTGTATTSNPIGLITSKYKDADGWKVTVFTDGASVTYGADTVSANIYAAPGYVDVFTLSGSDVSAVTNLTQAGSGVTDFDHVVVASFDATNGILGYKVLNSSNQTLGTTQYTLLNADTQIIDNSGTTAVAGTKDGLKIGRTIEIYSDGTPAGIADAIVLD